jgi:hypothetical protein
MSLQIFIADHRQELISRTRAKVAKRASPQPEPHELEHGVPIFLKQLAGVLEEEVASNGSQRPEEPNASPIKEDPIAKSASLHGQDLRKFGFSLEQVVHGYGDVCQAVTELAIEKDHAVTTAEFHTLNRCLDNAIAKAVTSWNVERERSQGGGPSSTFEDELAEQLRTAVAAFDALKAGRVGSTGATATALGGCLHEMQTILEARRR